MEDHVKLEIAIQLITEKIVDLFKKLDSARTYNEMQRVKAEIEEAMREKELILNGNIKAIDKIIAEKQDKKSQPEF